MGPIERGPERKVAKDKTARTIAVKVVELIEAGNREARIIADYKEKISGNKTQKLLLNKDNVRSVHDAVRSRDSRSVLRPINCAIKVNAIGTLGTFVIPCG